MHREGGGGGVFLFFVKLFSVCSLKMWGLDLKIISHLFFYIVIFRTFCFFGQNTPGRCRFIDQLA